MAAFRFHVRGRVQGVGYRYFVMQQAERLGLTGFTQNLPGGSVEVVAEGPAEALEALAEALQQGPAFSEVTDVSRAEIAPRGDRGFHIRR